MAIVKRFASETYVKDETNQISQEIINMKNENVPDYWLVELSLKADKIRQTMENAGRNKSAFLFYSDAHWNNGSQMSPKLLRYLYQHTAINRVIFGGDIVHNEPTTDTLSDRSIMEYLWDWRSQLKDLKHYSVVGNHDDGNATNNIFSSDYVYSYLFAPEDSPEIIRGGDTYYYFDDTREKTRYLMLDTGYEGLSALSDAQKTFINESLKSVSFGWRIIVVSHIWYMPDYDQYNVRPIPLVGLSSPAAELCTILDNYNARQGEFSACEGKVVLCIGGHVHRDYIDKTTGGIPIILCETDSANIRGEYPYTAKTTKESSINGIVVDYDADKVTVVRVGRGKSFVVILSTGAVTFIEDDDEFADVFIPNVEYTNMLLTAVNHDSSPIDGGYLENKRISGSSETGWTDATGVDATGWIPCKKGDIVRFYNIKFDNSDGTSYVCLSVYNAVGDTSNAFNYTALSDSTSNWKTVLEDGNIIQLTIPDFSEFTSEQLYFRICADDINKYSIITINEDLKPSDDNGDDSGDNTDTPDVPTYTNILDTVGWTENGRISGGDGGDRTNEGTDVTGFIPCSAGNDIYLKNVTLPDSEANNISLVGHYDADKNFISAYYYHSGMSAAEELELEYDENGNLTHFLVDWIDGVAYIRIVAQDINDTSIITVEEEIK